MKRFYLPRGLLIAFSLLFLPNSLSFLPLPLACHTSSRLPLFVAVPVVLSPRLRGLPGTHPWGPFLFCLPSANSHLWADFSARAGAGGAVGGERCWHSLPGGSRKPSFLPPDCSLLQLHSVLSFSDSHSADTPAHNSQDNHSRLSSLLPRICAQSGWRALHATALLLCALRKPPAKPPETIRGHPSLSRVCTRPLLSLCAVCRGSPPDECNPQKFLRQDKWNVPRKERQAA